MGKKKNQGVKKGSAQAKNYVTRLQAEAQERYSEKAMSNRQLCIDAMTITLHEELGYSGKRIERFVDAFTKNLSKICTAVVEDAKVDKEIAYSKADLDAALQQALGKYMTVIPFELRYGEEAKHDKAGTPQV